MKNSNKRIRKNTIPLKKALWIGGAALLGCVALIAIVIIFRNTVQFATPTAGPYCGGGSGFVCVGGHLCQCTNAAGQILIAFEGICPTPWPVGMTCYTTTIIPQNLGSTAESLARFNAHCSCGYKPTWFDLHNGGTPNDPSDDCMTATVECKCCSQFERAQLPYK